MLRHQCVGCLKVLPTQQGLSTHYSKKLQCRQQLQKAIRRTAEHHNTQSDIPFTSADESETFPDILDTEPEPVNNAPSAPPPPAEDAHCKRTRLEEEHPNQPHTYGTCKTSFEELREQQQEYNQPPWCPFESIEEWNLLRWLVTSGASQAKIDEFLKLAKVSRSDLKLRFKSQKTLFTYIKGLPQGPGWTCTPLEVKGDVVDGNGEVMKEILEVWHRDPVEVIKELVNTPNFKDHMRWSAERVFRDRDGTEREFSEMNTADWWWKIQSELPDGATVCPVIIASDETKLTVLSGDKVAWPVYLTIGNIDKDIRRKSSSYATVLLGYLPVSKLECMSAGRRSMEGNQLFHEAMKIIISPLVEAGTTGVEMNCADGFIRPSAKFKSLNLNPINPFWSNLPHCNIYECITPDIHHQLHKGVFHDHLVEWCTRVLGGTELSKADQTDEMDARFRTLPPHSTLRHFKKGISTTSQWTGKEFKNMEKVVRTTRAALDFIYYAQLEVHTTKTLQNMDEAWRDFHTTNRFLSTNGVRKHFNINKLHNIKHYIDHIRSRGTADGFNTEATERLHIDYAKSAYRASNHREYTKQMTETLQRLAAVHRFHQYLQWTGTVEEDVEQDGDDDEDDDEWNDKMDAGVLNEGGAAVSNEDEMDVNEKDDQTPDPSRAPTIAIPKRPFYPALTIASVEEDFDAPWLLYYMEQFLRSQGLQARTTLNDQHRIAVHQNMTIRLPSVPYHTSEPLSDVVHASKAIPAKLTPSGYKPAIPARFDTVLVRVEQPQAKKGDDEYLSDLRVARVRVIFVLPAQLGSFHEPLAYVNFFTPFREPMPHLNMYRVSLATRRHNHQEYLDSAVIPVSQIFRTCYLAPSMGRRVDRTWRSDTVLDSAQYFYFNPYLRLRDFVAFRYLLPARKAKDSQSTSSHRDKRLRTI
ncbi:hypothetical protein BDZ89DRAFT_1100216 [Hymenopellis radicata]|nr:hypothetical protein BDZ89DRAFT_1100216 [Hymenopellis radicata]